MFFGIRKVLVVLTIFVQLTSLVGADEAKITLTDIENSYDLSIAHKPEEVKVRGKRCIHDLLTNMLQHFCSKYQIPVAPGLHPLPPPHSLPPPRVQPVYVPFDYEPATKRPTPSKVKIEYYDNKNKNLDNDDDDDSDENDQDFKSPKPVKMLVGTEKRLLRRLQRLEGYYDTINEIEEKEQARKSGRGHGHRKLKMATNDQYADLKRKILAFDNPQKRVRLLVQLNKSFGNIIRTQTKIHEIHVQADPKSH